MVAILAAACQSPQKVPEGRIDTRTHPEYAKFRPVAVAVLPVDAPRTDLRLAVRKEVYRLLFEYRYSPFKLQTVDARMSSDGKWDPGGLDWDATFEVQVSRWKGVRGTDYFVGEGSATLRHKTGEILWSCRFSDYPFLVPEKAGQPDMEEAALRIAGLFFDKSRFPALPPPPSD